MLNSFNITVLFPRTSIPAFSVSRMQCLLRRTRSLHILVVFPHFRSLSNQRVPFWTWCSVFLPHPWPIRTCLNRILRPAAFYWSFRSSLFCDYFIFSILLFFTYYNWLDLFPSVLSRSMILKHAPDLHLTRHGFRSTLGHLFFVIRTDQNPHPFPIACEQTRKRYASYNQVMSRYLYQASACGQTTSMP